MPAPLYILVVDDRPDSILFLTEFLLSRGHRIETCCSGAEAQDAVLRRAVGQDPYDLLISDVAMPGMDGLTLLQELRRQKLEVPTALYTGYATINPGLTAKASQLGCLAVMDKPLELRRVERLIEEVAARKISTARIGRSQSRKEGSDRLPPSTGALERKSTALLATPTFGQVEGVRAESTGRTVVPASPGVNGTVNATASITNAFSAPTLPPDQAPQVPGTPKPVQSTTTLRRSATGDQTNATRKPSGLFLHNTDSIAKRHTTTARIRRTISGSHLPQTPLNGTQSETTSRHGRPNPGDSSRAVSCAHCAKIFLVLIRPVAYNSVCVHCGGLNRIDPF